MKRLLYILLFVIVSLPIYANARLDSLFVDAVYGHNFDLMSQYAEQGANVDIRHRGYDHLMHYYAAKDDIDGVQWCINHHMDVNQLDSLGATPLIHATCDGYSTICKLLIDNGANTQIKSSYGMTASEYAKHNTFTALAAFIENPSLPLPLDYYNCRRKIARALRNAEYEKAKSIATNAIETGVQELASNSRYIVYLLLDLAGVYGQEGDYGSQIDYLDAACIYAEKHMPNSEIYYRAKISQHIGDLSLLNADSLLYYHNYSDKFLSVETKWLAEIGVSISAEREGYVREADAILYSALDDAIYLANDDAELYSDLVIHTLSLILDFTAQIGDAKAMEEAEMASEHLRSFIAGRHDYVAAMARVRIGHYYNFIGQAGLAKIWYQRACADLERTVGKNHRNYIENIFNLGNVEMGRNIDSAFVYFNQAKDALERIDNMDSYIGAMVEQSIAICKFVQYIHNSQEYAFPDDAESLFLDAWEKMHKYGANRDFNIAVLAENIALYYMRSKEYGNARQYAYDAISLIEELVGKNNQRYLSATLATITLESNVGNHEKVDSLIANYFTVATNLINDQFLVLNESTREDIWENVYSYSFRQYLPSIISTSIAYQPSLSRALYNCALFSKGILLHTSNEIQSRLREMHDPEINQFLDAIIYNKKRLYEIEQAYPGEYPDEWGQLIRDIDGMENVVLDLGKKYQDKLSLNIASWEDIQESLTNAQAAVEILRYDYCQPVNPVESTYYVATIVTKDSEIPQYVYLFEESELTSLINSSNKDNVYDYNRNGRQLSEMIWSKLLPYIGDAQTIYFSPDGMLCQLAVEALPLSADSVYGDAYNIVRCSSTKYILQQRQENQPTSVDLFGGIQYDMTPVEMTSQSNAIAMRDAYRGEMPDSLTRGHYGELAGAKEEVYSILQLLNKANIDGRLYIGSNASEEAFKALSGSHPNVLHIATHGFFWPQEEAERKDYFMASFMANNKVSRYVSSMERAGLLFAGANVAMTGHRDELPSNVEDGVLSAQEISTMDLYGTDLVVLSACETGQGDLEGDGVYGLQRAFKLAGVQTIIMSLWKVNDAATQMLMTEFYSHWIVNKMSKRKAFETAREKVRAKYPEPSCWAGFIMLD